MCGRMVSGIPGLYLLDASNTTTSTRSWQLETSADIAKWEPKSTQVKSPAAGGSVAQGSLSKDKLHLPADLEDSLQNANMSPY